MIDHFIERLRDATDEETAEIIREIVALSLMDTVFVQDILGSS